MTFWHRDRCQPASRLTTRYWPQSGSQARPVHPGCVDNPGRVLGSQPQDQPPQLEWGAPATGAVASRPSPASLHQIPVPPHDRGRGDDPMPSARRGQQSGQRREHRPIRPGQSWPAHLVAQYRYLVAQHEDFRIFRVCAAGQQSQPGQDLPEDQIQQSYRHDRRSCPTATLHRCPQVTAVDDQFGTHKLYRNSIDEKPLDRGSGRGGVSFPLP